MVFPDFAKYTPPRVEPTDTAETLAERARTAGAYEVHDFTDPNTGAVKNITVFMFIGFTGEPACLSFDALCKYIELHARVEFRKKWRKFKMAA